MRVYQKAEPVFKQAGTLNMGKSPQNFSMAQSEMACSTVQSLVDSIPFSHKTFQGRVGAFRPL